MDDMGTSVKRLEKEVLQLLAEAGGKLTAEDDVVFQGTKIILPEKNSLQQTVDFLQRKMQMDEEETRFGRVYNYRPWDGARATMHAIRRTFGAMGQEATYTFFGKQPPQLVDLPTGVNTTEQVPWGKVTIPLLPGTVFHVGASEHPELGSIFALAATGPRKYRFEIEGVFNLIQKELETNSMYRGKAFDGATQPNFLDLSGVDPDKVVYSQEVMTQLEANVWALLRYTENMRQLSIPLKRAVLFEGPYGTGKTLGAYLTAKEAVDNGWTFVYCRPGRDDLDYTIQTARLYQPAVVFFEDIDIVGGTDGGANSLSRLLDLFDGLQAKDSEIVCVLTTNHVDQIHKGMVRPGRLDSVIHIGELDDDGMVKLITSVVPPQLMSPDIQWDKVCRAMEGMLPAFVREAIDRTLRYNLARNQGRATQLTTDDFVEAAVGLRPQLALMSDAGEREKRPTLETAISSTVREAVSSLRIRNEEWGDSQIIDPED